ncbi:MAG: carboxypeptidase regulatory-like domain-containing protein [Gemmatimonadales bacterium]
MTLLRRLIHRSFSLTLGALLVGGCREHATAPQAARFATLSVAPVLPSGATTAQVTRIRFLLQRYTNETTTVAVDTSVDLAPAQDSVLVEIRVPLQAQVEPFLLTVTLTNANGDVLYVGGPIPILVSASDGAAAPIEVPLLAVANGVLLGEVRDAVTYNLIVGATVRLGPVGGALDRQATTGADGSFRFEAVAPGTYQAEATAAGYVVNTAANVSIIDVTGGDIARADFALPPTSSTQRFGSLSGRVFDQNGTPFAGATVTISGGSQTNGVFRATVTQSDGTYALIGIVLDDVNGAPITSFVVEVSAASRASASRTVTLVQNQTVTNLDLRLGAGVPVTVFFTDGFESGMAWTASGFWNQNRLLGLRNSANPTYVDLAPDDSSGGSLPAPAAGTFALWYGEPASGNFLGQQDPNDTEKSGGTSQVPNEGTVLSPAFAIPATSQRATLRFDTWFEIESQNPNENGFDIMSIQVQDEATGITTELGRLNPFEDPTFFPRSATPYTSAGFNRAPVWRPVFVDLSAFRGQTVRIGFAFTTVDQLYNGFRGWIIDNVQVSDEVFSSATAASARLAPAANAQPRTRRSL